MNPYVLIGVGAVLGANARYLASTWAANAFGVGFPFGTLLVNASGSFLLGLLLTLLADRFSSNVNATLLLATGFLGAYTTFSTFVYETIALIRRRETSLMFVNLAASLIAGLGGAVLGVLGAAAGRWL